MIYKYYKERFVSIFAPAIKLITKGLALKADTYQSCNNFCSYCTVKGTKIILSNGDQKEVQNIKIGDKVLSININDNFKREDAIVKQVFERKTDELYKLKFQRKTLKITGNHPVFTQNGWKKVEELRVGDKVRWFQVYTSKTRKKFSDDKLKNKNPNYVDKIKIKCLNCKKVFEVKPFKKDRIYCSISCKMKHKNPMKKEKVSKKVHDALKKLWKNKIHPNKGRRRPDFSKYLRENNPMKNPKILKKVRAKGFATLKKNNMISKGEQLLMDYLDELGVKYVHNYPFKSLKGYYFLDVALKDSKINIEYDGHQRHFLKKGILEDRRRDRFLKKKGWKVLRIKRNAIFNKEIALKTIESFLQKNLHNPSSLWSSIIKIEKIKGETTVYNLGCTPNNNYLAEKYLVHNCFAHEMRECNLAKTGIKQNMQVARLLNLQSLANFMERASKHEDYKNPYMNWAIRNKYYIELGTTGETFQEEDRYFRTTYNFIRLMSDFKIPLFINTKMNLLCHDDEYKKLLINYKAPIIFCVTLTTEDDKLGKIYEAKAPLPSERLKAMKELNSYDHINSYVYISPYIPSVSDQNIEKFVNLIIDAGAVGAYVRDFYLQGRIFSNPFWQKWLKENKKHVELFTCGMHLKYETKKEFYLKFQKEAYKYDKDFKVLGMKSKWFELNPYHGRNNFDRLSQPFKDGVMDLTAIPLLRKIRENLDKPQLLIWNKIGHKKGKINLPEKINTNEGGINTLMEGGCNCNTSDISYFMDGYDWMVTSMWNGLDPDKPTGFFKSLEYVFPVKEKGKFKRDDDGNFMYAYLPKEYWEYLTAGKQKLLFSPSASKDIKGAGIEYSIAKDFQVPEREGDTSDKWLKKIPVEI